MLNLKFSHISAILSGEQKKRSLKIIALVTFGMFLEAVGVGIIIPVVAIISDVNIASNYPVLGSMLSWIGSPEHSVICIYAMLMLVGLYLFKSLFLSYSIRKESEYIFSLQEDLSSRLFSCYMYQPYSFHLENNSSKLIHNILAEVNVFVFKVVSPLMKMVSECFLLSVLSVLLLIVEPLGAISVLALLALGGWIIHRMTRHRMSHWGKKRQFHESQVVQHLQQGLGGIKDSILLNQEQNFIDEVSVHNAGRVSIGKKEIIYQQYPRLWIEFIAMLGLSVIVFAMIYQGKPVGTIMPTLGVFAAAAFRLMPSVNRFIVSFQSLKFGQPAIEVLFREFSRHQMIPSLGQNTEKFSKSIEVKNLSFKYPSASTLTLDGVSLRILAGESVGIVGESGSGKSTLADCILGLQTPDNGAIEVDGQNIQDKLRTWQRQIGYVSQSIYLTDSTLKKNIAFGIPDEEINGEAVKKAIQMAQLDKFVSTLPEGLETVVGERGVRLSGGQRQRIGIARALYHDPSILVLDEATSSLDIPTEREVMKSVYAIKGQKTLIIIAHRLSTISNCDRIYHMGNGKVLEEGRAADIISRIELTSKNQ